MKILRLRDIKDRTDEELVSLLSQDKRALQELVHRYQNPIYNFARRLLGNQEDAFDVTQETFVRLINSAHAFKGLSRFSTWLFTIAANLCRDHLRERKKLVLWENDLEEKNPGGLTLTEDLPSAEEIVEAQELREELVRKLDQLSPKLREAIVLVDIQELKYAEIAEMLGISIGTVKSRVSRAREELRASLIQLREQKTEEESQTF
ncbi:RNA polymerase sigma-70 factor, ECF subfamily [Candidatus Hakubella thermalkaliphila]|uniref:RNA polymerase sigma-70 factor, ECF subfamily n=2 Tax=Candidatus Hakubella thermalkaliphila TaxID=2754717 RepID=A0A6V8PBK6_9ACTN|nr:RNA polymerase sigma factor [Candidatus Hakubella thermalkaliphila]GFP23450.1 RNA polymerase sigma-70 factor, ECF subfamily [Candidatus Hakubella thermalkaliphila]GFP29678.1 RNA polymerase sigma-70 factor, ECF subfamily [Candidatus Hakubella thermalkaliphila]GFP36375.1 RNA polymerase sigma-70 factor, ECF subfamily [Candidatus Hakubella thermalkaliphila]